MIEQSNEMPNAIPTTEGGKPDSQAGDISKGEGETEGKTEGTTLNLDCPPQISQPYTLAEAFAQHYDQAQEDLTPWLNLILAAKLAGEILATIPHDLADKNDGKIWEMLFEDFSCGELIVWESGEYDYEVTKLSTTLVNLIMSQP